MSSFLSSSLENVYGNVIPVDHVEGQEDDCDSVSKDTGYDGPITRSRAKKQRSSQNVTQAASLVYEPVVPAGVNQLPVYLAQSLDEAWAAIKVTRTLVYKDGSYLKYDIRQCIRNFS